MTQASSATAHNQSSSNSLVSIANNRAVTTSTVVAKAFNKQHSHVTRSIQGLLNETGDWGVSNFGDTFVTNAQNGEKYPAYEITRDGFTLLAMGFTGKKALQFKIAYIDAFNKMETELARILKDSRAPYSIGSADILSANEAEEIRMALKAMCDKLPKDKQATFMVKGWSRLKSHFGVNYRQIPRSEYSEALSLVTRYASEWEVLDTPAQDSLKRYDFPKEMLLQKFFCGTEDDGALRLPKLDLRMMGHPKFTSSIAKLLTEMHADGNNVDAPYAEFMAIQSGLRSLESQVASLSFIGSNSGNDVLKMMYRQAI